MTPLVILSLSLLLFTPHQAFAHCPLCTGGAGAAAAAAALLGVKYGAISVFIGGFATALTLWLMHKLSHKLHQLNIRYKIILGLAIYLSTVIPMYPLLKNDYTSIYLSINGDYGSLLNRTYLIDLFYIGIGFGTLIVLISPKLSSLITTKLGKTLRFQGLALTLVLLLFFTILLQILPR